MSSIPAKECAAVGKMRSAIGELPSGGGWSADRKALSMDSFAVTRSGAGGITFRTARATDLKPRASKSLAAHIATELGTENMESAARWLAQKFCDGWPLSRKRNESFCCSRSVPYSERVSNGPTSSACSACSVRANTYYYIKCIIYVHLCAFHVHK